MGIDLFSTWSNKTSRKIQHACKLFNANWEHFVDKICLFQRSPTSLVPRAGFLEDNFSIDLWQGGCFGDDSSTLRLSCTLFLLLLHQLHLRSGIRSWRLGTPVLHYLFKDVYKVWTVLEGRGNVSLFWDRRLLCLQSSIIRRRSASQGKGWADFLAAP